MGPFISYEGKKCCEYVPRDHIHNASFSMELKKGHNKLEGCITLRLSGDKHSSLFGSLISYERKKCSEYGPKPLSQYFFCL